MKKIFLIAALALSLAACSKQELRPVENEGMITLTATLAPKGAATKALADAGTTLKAEWAVGEELAILYQLGGADKNSTANVISVDDVTGAATIEFSVESGTTDGAACTVIYPASAAKNFTSGLKSNEELLGSQPGVLHDRLDIRVATGSIRPVTPDASLVLRTPLSPQFAIVKFTLDDGENELVARSLAVTIGEEAFVATPASAAGEFYLALPAVSSGTLIFSVPGSSGTDSYRCFRTGVTLEAGKYYRSTLSMTAQSTGADHVAMGDGLKWALKNVGAGKPADYGDYFAWGETEPYYQSGYSEESPMAAEHWKSGKTGYNWANYGLANGAYYKLTKYCPTDMTDSWAGTGSPDDKLVLEADDDAATAILGSGWRMPTDAEWNALLNREDFTWSWVTNFNGSGKKGRLVISRKSGFEGNCIFLPAAGYRNGANRYGAGYDGYYWSSSLQTGDPNGAYDLYFNSGNAEWSHCFRYYGHAVRPVTD